MKLTVAICTRNRSALLRATLERMKLLRATPEIEWELIVVDNGSTDDTRGVVDSYAQELPIQYVFEPRTGHTIARNRAIALAAGEAILWTDDDVLVNEEWLVRYGSALSRWPEASFFGGNIEPDFEERPPDWLTAVWPAVAGMYAVREFPEEEFVCDPVRIPFGANFAVRTNVQKRYLFDERLGRRGRALSAGDETVLLKRMMADGHWGRWVPGASVKHFIPKERLRARYLWGNYYHQGARFGSAQESKAASPWFRQVIGRLWGVTRNSAACCLTNRHRDPHQWLARFRSISVNLGGLMSLWRDIRSSAEGERTLGKAAESTHNLSASAGSHVESKLGL